MPEVKDPEFEGGPARLTVRWTEGADVAHHWLELRSPVGRLIEQRRVDGQGEGTEHEETFDRLDGPAEYSARLTPYGLEGDEGSRAAGADRVGYAVPGDRVTVELRAPYPDPPEGGVEGTAHLTEAQAADVVIVRRPDGEVLDVTYPDRDGDYTARVDAPVLLEAHAFDPERWRGKWRPETDYQRGDVIVPSDPDSDAPLLQAADSGTSGTAEPDWPQRGSVDDGEITWASLGPVRDCAPVVNLYDGR